MDYQAWVGVYCFIGMIVLILVGVPIFISIFAAALVGSWLIGGSAFTLTQFTNAPYSVTASYGFAVVPLFILMGVLAGESGVAESTYAAVSKWMSKIRGGLLMATVIAAAFFGACSGSSLAGSAVFAKISLPELKKYGYDMRTSMGCIAASGALSSLIPPSVSIVIFCILVNVSIGKALVAGIVPGIITALVLVFTVWIVGMINPKRLPTVDVKVTWREKFSSVKLLWPILFLFLIVIGGMYAGVFPPTVGGAIGAVGILLYALVRRVSKKRLINSFRESVLINVQIFPLLIAGFLFSRFIALSGLPGVLVDMILKANMPPIGVMALVVVIYLFLGCVMELMSILVITLPIIFPIMVNLGFDPIALCIIIVFLTQLGALTPPIGVNCFVVASVAKVNSMEVFRGIIPYFFAQVIVLWLIIFFPGIATWLPNLLY